MMKEVTVQEMRRIEKAADVQGLPFSRMMQNAGAAVAQYVNEHATLQGKQTVVLCGSGNNGGDGFVVAHYLKQYGADVTAVLAGSPPQDGFALQKYRQMCADSVPMLSLSKEPYLVADTVRNAKLIIDAVFGIGFHDTLPDALRPLFQQINHMTVPVVAVDIPSGVHADTGECDEDTLQAKATVTFTALKKGMRLGAAPQYCGKLVVADIGIDPGIVERVGNEEPIDWARVKNCFPPREENSHKGTYGNLLAVCGSYGMAGAAALAGNAAYRCGTGLVTMAVPRSVYPIVAGQVPEAVFAPLEESPSGVISGENAELLAEASEKASAVLVGCGLGNNAHVEQTVLTLLHTCKKPMVLDADGINVLQGHIHELKTVSCPIILTPHPGEFARLLNKPVEEIERDRNAAATSFADEYGVIVVLKGHKTVVAVPGNLPMVNPTGNPGMAVAGSGDCLAGMIGGFLAQGMSAADAAMCGVLLHGMAGDLAAHRCSQHSMLPRDLLDELGQLFLKLESRS